VAERLAVAVDDALDASAAQVAHRLRVEVVADVARQRPGEDDERRDP